MQGLCVRIARALNRLWSRRGTVFGDRYHGRILKTPREVRSTLRYVLRNHANHGIQLRGPDPFSTGPWFDGWMGRVSHELGVAAYSPVPPPRTWLARLGWKRWGLIPCR